MSDQTFSIAEVSEMVGLTPHTIRAWERRYGAVSPGRSKAGQRRYTLEDVELLRRVKQGVALKGLSLKLAVLRAQGELVEPEIESAPIADLPRLEPAGDQPPWRAMADLIDAPMLIVGTDGRIVDANTAFARTAGAVRESLRGRRFADLVDPHDRAKAVKAYRPPLRPRLGWELNVRTPETAGLYSFDCRPVRWGGHWVLGMIGAQVAGESERQGGARA